ERDGPHPRRGARSPAPPRPPGRARRPLRDHRRRWRVERHDARSRAGSPTRAGRRRGGARARTPAQHRRRERSRRAPRLPPRRQPAALQRLRLARRGLARPDRRRRQLRASLRGRGPLRPYPDRDLRRPAPARLLLRRLLDLRPPRGLRDARGLPGAGGHGRLRLRAPVAPLRSPRLPSRPGHHLLAALAPARRAADRPVLGGHPLAVHAQSAPGASRAALPPCAL
ncbi:MAG: hypothetical protein AVDCRST_MAG17-1821, partial [uncultured Solirubrobacterales bacterium]